MTDANPRPHLTVHAPESIELTHDTRELMLATATTEVGAEDLVRARELIAEATRVLRKSTRHRLLRSGFEASALARAAQIPFEMAHTNPASIPLTVDLDGDRARSTVTVNSLYEGPPDSVHGGTVGWLLDSITGILLQSQGTPAVTGSLDIRYLRRTPLDQPLVLHSEIVERSDRKFLIDGWIEHDEERTAQCRGVFIRVERGSR